MLVEQMAEKQKGDLIAQAAKRSQISKDPVSETKVQSTYVTPVKKHESKIEKPKVSKKIST